MELDDPAAAPTARRRAACAAACEPASHGQCQGLVLKGAGKASSAPGMNMAPCPAMVVPPDRLAAVQRGVRGTDGAHGAVDPVEPVGGVGRAAAERRLQAVDALDEAAAVLGVDLAVLGEQAHDGHAGARGHHDVLQHARAEVAGDRRGAARRPPGACPRRPAAARWSAPPAQPETSRSAAQASAGSSRRSQRAPRSPAPCVLRRCVMRDCTPGVSVVPRRPSVRRPRGRSSSPSARRRSSCPWPSRPRRRRCRRGGP